MKLIKLILLLIPLISVGQQKFNGFREELIKSKKYEYVYAYENNYAAFRTFNDKMGLIDTLGNVIIKPKYSYINNKKELKNVFEAAITVNKKYKRGFIDLQENIKIPFEYDDLYYLGNNLVNVSKNNKTGVVNLENKVVLPLKYDYVREQNGILFVQTNNTIDLFNFQGKQITNFKAADIEYFKFNKSIVTLQNKNTLVIDTLGNVILNSIKNHQFEEIITSDSYIIRDIISKKKGVIKSNGQYQIECKYEDIRPESSIYIVKDKNKDGIIDKKDAILKHLVYDHIYSAFYRDSIHFKDQYHAYKGDLQGIINPYLEKDVLPVSFKHIEHFSNCYITTNSKGQNGVFSALGKVIIPEEYEFYNIGENKIFAVKNAKEYLLSLENNTYTETEVLFGEFIKNKFNFSGFSKSRYQIFKAENKFGVIDNKNKLVIPAEYDFIQEIYATGEFIVKKNNKYGVINADNQIRLELKYDSYQHSKEYIGFKIKNQKAIKAYAINFSSAPKID